MKIVNFIKNIVSPSADEQLAKLDAHLLADIGINTAFGRTTDIRIPADLGIRLV